MSSRSISISSVITFFLEPRLDLFVGEEPLAALGEASRLITRGLGAGRTTKSSLLGVGITQSESRTNCQVRVRTLSFVLTISQLRRPLECKSKRMELKLTSKARKQRKSIARG
jgi:hypothetical protein